MNILGLHKACYGLLREVTTSGEREGSMWLKDEQTQENRGLKR